MCMFYRSENFLDLALSSSSLSIARKPHPEFRFQRLPQLYGARRQVVEPFKRCTLEACTIETAPCYFIVSKKAHSCIEHIDKVQRISGFIELLNRGYFQMPIYFRIFNILQ